MDPIVDRPPVLTVAVPLYNMAGYLCRCLDSMTDSEEPIPPEDLEILVVDDGSTDTSADVARRYVEAHPNVKLLQKANGGHGSAIDHARGQATGLYFFVVDSDDLVVPSSLRKVVSLLRWLHERGVVLDVLVLERIIHYDKDDMTRRQDYKGILPVGRTFGWDETGRFDRHAYLPMHSLVFRRSLLTEAALCLPEHTFYVDNLYAYVPLARSKVLYHLPVPLYVYHIGREGQSVSMQTALTRIDDHLRVTRAMTTTFDCIPAETDRRLVRYMADSLYSFLLVSLALLSLSDREDKDRQKKALISWMRSHHRKIYRTVASRPLVLLAQIPGAFGDFLVRLGYRIADAKLRFE